MKPESKTFHELAVPSFSESVVVHDPELVEAIQGGYRKAKRIQAIKAAVAARAKQATKTSRKHARALGFHAFFIEHAVLWFQSAIDAQLQLVVPNIQELNHRIITEAHDLIYGGYAGVHRTYLRLSDSWYWFKMVRSIHKYECEPCRRNKPRLTKPTGLVEPLAVPEERWREISMDFITDLPRTKAGHDAILVGVDGLMKCMRFFVTKKTMTAPEVANPLIEHIWKLRARSDHV
ncbi:TPA: hypothetical protein N0F65_009669 [Lagenidium giganteum]|uniref:Integrase zinc-binding domain-containing protein n=1 Tax=Lagenidium giganteum TaxID=4803 RepID=A0AAV2YV04_9STRA|nr:TPA: hypothetical protein N0F65_009669 [Lagenidium giganteum]